MSRPAWWAKPALSSTGAADDSPGGELPLRRRLAREQLGHRHEAQAAPTRRTYECARDQRRRGVRIVQEHDRACLQLWLDRANNRPRPGTDPRIAAVDAPADVEEPERSHDAILSCGRLLVGWSEHTGHRADGSADDPLRAFELGSDRARCEPAEVGMTPRVVAQNSDPGCRPHCARPDADTAADHEERRARVLLPQHADEPKRVRARPVVERQSDVASAQTGAVDGLGRVRQPLNRRQLGDRGERERAREHDADEDHYEISRTSASGIAWMSASVPTGKTACGVPPAHQMVTNRRRDASTTVRTGRPWPTGGTPPIAKPVASRTSSPRACRTFAPSSARSTRRSPAHKHRSGPASSTKTSDFTIWPTSTPAAAAASAAVRVESESSRTSASRPSSPRRSWTRWAVGCKAIGVFFSPFSLPLRSDSDS